MQQVEGVHRFSGSCIGIGHAEIQGQHGQQHEDPAHKSVDKELDSGILPSGTAPQTDQKNTSAGA